MTNNQTNSASIQQVIAHFAGFCVDLILSLKCGQQTVKMHWKIAKLAEL